MKRHTCIICGKKRYEDSMTNVFYSSWACTFLCSNHVQIGLAKELFAFIDRNRSDFTLFDPMTIYRYRLLSGQGGQFSRRND